MKWLFFALAVSIGLIAGCSGRPKTYPVTGELFIDDKPAEDAMIYFHPTGESAKPDSPRPLAQVDKDGKFSVSTYVSGDGAPAGEYIVCFEWRERSGLMKQNLDGPDRLGGQYYDKEKSQTKVTIGKEPTTLPRFKLTMRR